MSVYMPMTSRRLWRADQSGHVSAKSWCIGNGQAEAANLQRALNSVSGYGDTLQIPTGMSIYADQPVTAGTAPLSIAGGGKILLGVGSAYAGLIFEPPASSPITVSAISASVEYPTSSGTFVSRLTLASMAGVSRNSKLFIYSTDLYSTLSGGDASMIRGELVMALSVDAGNSYVYLADVLADTYTTAGSVCKVIVLNEMPLSIEGVGFEYVGDPWSLADADPSGYAAVVPVGAVDVTLDLRVKNLPYAAVRPVTCWGGTATLRGGNLRDGVAYSAQKLGYGVVPTAATRGMQVHLDLTRVRHGFTTVLYSRPGYPLWNAGCPREIVVSGVVRNSISAAFDTHPGAHDIVFKDAWAFHTNMDDDGVPSGGAWGFQDRSCNTKFIGCGYVGNYNAILFSGHLNNHNKENVTQVSACSFEVGSTKSVAGFAVKHGSSTGRIDIRASMFRGGQIVPANACAKVQMKATVLDMQTAIRLGANNDFRFYETTRISTAACEAVRMAGGSTVTAVNWTQDGDVAVGTPGVFCMESTGTGVLKHANVQVVSGSLSTLFATLGGTATKTALTALT